MPADNLRRGAFNMTIATVLFAIMGAMVKHISGELPNEMVAFFRSAIGLLTLLPFLGHRHSSLRTKRPAAQIVRSLVGLGSMYCFFYAVAHLPLAEAVLLNYSAPLFIPFIAWLWLREPMTRRVLFAIGLGFVGVALILKPGLSLFTPVALVGLASGVLAAIAMVGVRELSSSETSYRIVFYYTLTCALVSAIPLAWSWRTPTASLWAPILIMGGCATLGHLFMTRAYALAPAALTGPFMYATVIFAALIGWGFWGEVPDALSLAGAVTVCVAGVLTIRFGGRRALPATELPLRQ
jgi:drug/metabolite transporter (DMT)-like permease